MKLSRCSWCGDEEPYVSYHDKEWGVPLHDDQKLFELIILEGAQAGLSWITVLKRRDGYRQAFDNFVITKVARFDEKKIAKLMDDPGIIRNRLKISSAIKNAQAVLTIQKEFDSLDKYLWQFVKNKPVQHKFKQLSDLPAVDDIAIEMSKDLKKRGLNFVGPTICYAFMQSTGMVNDHMITCFRYKELSAS
jgi:DNA-3-methyladenine glycosylase I